MDNTQDITADLLDNDAQGTQYAHKALKPSEAKFVINETIIRAPNLTPLEIKAWQNAHVNAISRYFPNRTWLYDIYYYALLDGHLTGILSKRWDTVLNKPLHFKKKGKIIDALTPLINSLPFRDVCRHILESQAWGISGIEFEPGPTFSPLWIDRKHIKPKWQIISYEQTGNTGIDYTTLKNVLIVGQPEDLGFLLKCVPYIIYKRDVYGSWSQYIDIFGQPIRIMYYDAYDQQAKIELKQTLDASGGSLALMIPKGVEFDIKDGKVTNGDGKLQQTMVESVNSELSVIVLGNEQTTAGKAGSMAKAKVHKDQQEEISKSDIAYLVSWLNSPQFLQILKSYGYPVENGAFEYTQEISIEYLVQRIAIDVQLPETLPISDDYWYETYGIEKPENYKELKKQLMDRQKVLQNSDSIQNDPKNQPKTKPKALSAGRNASNSPLERGRGVSKLRNLINTITAFFDHARTE